MSGQDVTPITAEVRTSSLMDRLVITPRQRDENSHAFVRALRVSFPNVVFHRSIDGIWVPAEEASALLATSPGLDFRWSPEALAQVENRRRVKLAYASLRETVNLLRIGGREMAAAHLHDVTGLEALDDHQWVTVAAMTLPEGFGLCVFDEQGVGKTVTSIFAFDVLAARDQADFALIVAPKSMVPEWPQDFARFKGGLYEVRVVAGTTRQRHAALSSGADVLVTNFETVVSMEGEMRALLRQHQGRAVLVVDESFYIKNLDTKRSQALRRLREWCGRAYVLCGTPAPNAPQDVIQQFNIVDFGITFAGIDVPKDRQQAQPLVQRAIEERGLFVRHLKSAVLPDLPLKTFHRILLPLQPEQRRLYLGALRDLVLDLRSSDDAAFQRHLGSFLARRSALLQICSNPIAIASEYTETPAKLLALDSLLDEIITKRGEKVVLWSFYTASLDAIAKRYAHLNPVRYDGTVADVDDRRIAVRRFQDDDETMLFVANPAAAGAGLTLHRARVAVYESMSNQAAHYLQSLDRIHRRGQAREVEYMVLLCDRTLEIQEYQRLIEKERTAQELLGDPIREPVTRQAMLAEAMETGQLLGEAL